MDRRSYLSATAVVALAGCLESENTDSETENGDADPDADDQSTDPDANETDGSTDADPDGTDAETNESDASDRPVAFDERWAYDLETDAADRVTYDAAIGADAVVVGSRAGLTAIDLARGTTLWERAEWDSFQAVYADRNGVVAVADGSAVVGLEAGTGKIVWSEGFQADDIDGLQSATTAAYAVVSTDSATKLIDRADGTVTTASVIGSDVTVAGGTVLVRNGAFLTAIDPADGSERWSITDYDIEDGAAGTDELAVVPTSNGLKAFDPETGGTVWDVDLGPYSFFQSRVGIGDDVAVLVDRDDVLHAVDLEAGRREWSTDLGDVRSVFAPPATTESLVVAENEDGVTAYDEADGEELDSIDPFVVIAGLAADGTFVTCRRTVTAYDLLE